ncbi:MAG TPA: NADH-quinone oxidoreductase subunit N [Candidatus Acidoferrales bacterium]|nr:NADH-quinone oxidoreductase subunit N [Candidatus Acidoferrales bacterium]
MMPIPISPERIEDAYRVAPEIILCASGIFIMLLDPFLPAARKRICGWVAVIGAIGALASLWLVWQHRGPAYGGLIRADEFSIFIHGIVLTVAILAALGSMQYLDNERIQRGEYYSLLLFAAAGMGILGSAGELVTAFLGLEMSSISTYILAGFRRTSLKSNEASLKYFILGSFATAFFLYGIAMVYGATGTTTLARIQESLANSGPNLLEGLGIAMMFVGLGFKVVAAPFQVYAPDVYEGAPTPVTAVLASAPKAATFALMLRIFYTAFGSAGQLWFWVIWIAAVLSMCIGNFAALNQTNIKRMLAYSSIAHAGYILVAFAAASEIGAAAVLFYLAAYALMKLGAFLVVAQLGGPGERRLEIKDYAGLGTQQPVLAACFSLFLLSLLGLPATGGFLGKFYAFQAALDSRLVWLVVIAAINSVIGSYYYLRVIVSMYFWDPQKEFQPVAVTPGIGTALAIAAAGTIYLGIFPSRAMQFALLSALSLR